MCSLNKNFRNQIIFCEISRLCLPGLPITQNLSYQDIYYSPCGKTTTQLSTVTRKKEGSSQRGHDELSYTDVLFVLDTKCVTLHMALIWIKGDVTAEEILPVGRTESTSHTLASIWLEAQTPPFSSSPPPSLVDTWDGTLLQPRGKEMKHQSTVAEILSAVCPQCY